MRPHWAIKGTISRRPSSITRYFLERTFADRPLAVYRPESRSPSRQPAIAKSLNWILGFPPHAKKHTRTSARQLRNGCADTRRLNCSRRCTYITIYIHGYDRLYTHIYIKDYTYIYKRQRGAGGRVHSQRTEFQSLYASAASNFVDADERISNLL